MENPSSVYQWVKGRLGGERHGVTTSGGIHAGTAQFDTMRVNRFVPAAGCRIKARTAA
jgi:hypothetical protein